MKTFTIIANRVFHTLDCNHCDCIDTHIRLFDITVIDDNWGETAVLDAIRTAIKEYALTKDGKKLVKEDSFTPNNVLTYIPYHILSNNGICSIEEKDYFTIGLDEPLTALIGNNRPAIDEDEKPEPVSSYWKLIDI